MVFDMILSSNGMVVLGFAAQERISVGELKHLPEELLFCNPARPHRWLDQDLRHSCGFCQAVRCRASRSTSTRLEA